MKIYYLPIIALLVLSCDSNVKIDTAIKDTITAPAKGDSYRESADLEIGSTNPTEVLETPSDILVDTTNMDVSPDVPIPSSMPSYPEGPHSMELFKVIPNMTFYNPWRDEWFSLSDLYQHEEHKAFILVSSAGWCGPCLKEAAALIELYDKYHDDGLEIIYTLGNTNIPGDVPFDTTAGDLSSVDFAVDMLFMENWQLMTQNEADQVLNYQMYADPNREFIKYLPQHAWPLSLLVTTKDMGVRLVEEGYWSALMENKIMLVLYNDVPTIPFQ